jgi:simple sugar transport system substrate-binding protein
VDYIVLDPIVETGWTSSLREAREAGIPVIIADREVKLEDESLYTAWIGSDFLLEGKRACAWLEAFAQAHDLDGALQILHIQGTEGSSAQIGRSQALYDAAEKNGWNILQSVCGDFVQAKGKEVAERALADCKEDVQVIYCENDNMAYGVIEALEDAGKKAGTDVEHGEILLISFDSASEGLSCTLDGTIAVDTECNPLYGPALSRMIMDLELGRTVEKKNYCEEEQFSAWEEIKAADVDGINYPVTMVTEELIKERVY